MSFEKVTYKSGETVITADNLNAIQDELIRVAGLLGKDIQSAAINDSGHLILTLTDGTPLDAGVAKGAQGEKGATGPAGPQGVTPHIGDNGNWYIGSTDTGKPSRGVAGAKGADGANGKDGAQGEKGADGKTPVRGTDYWTAADKQEIVNSVIAALPDGTEVSY